MKTLFLFLLVMMVLTGCYYDNEATLYPGSNTCTSVANPSFSADIMPLLNMKCNNCHSGSTPSASIRLDNYTEVVKHVNNKSLMGSINHASGYSAMPKGGYKMPSCEIQKIQDWISNGILNN